MNVTVCIFQMQQGRRTASLKASYEAIHGSGAAGGAGGAGGVAPELSISKELAGAAQTAIAAIQDTHKKNKKSVTTLKRFSIKMIFLMLSTSLP